jgi:hypothetical protein
MRYHGALHDLWHDVWSSRMWIVGTRRIRPRYLRSHTLPTDSMAPCSRGCALHSPSANHRSAFEGARSRPGAQGLWSLTVRCNIVSKQAQHSPQEDFLVPGVHARAVVSPRPNRPYSREMPAGAVQQSMSAEWRCLRQRTAIRGIDHLQRPGRAPDGVGGMTQ